MKSKRTLISIAILIFLIINSCSKGDQSGLGPTGSLEGTVSVFDEFGTLLTDKSGVTITIDGIFPPLSATTDIDGKYKLDKLPTGRYVIIFSKSGYADRKASDYPFIADESSQILNSSISQVSNTLVTELILSPLPSGGMTTSFTVSPEIPADLRRYVRFYFSNSASVSSTNYLSTFTVWTATSLFSDDVYFDDVLFPIGTTLYVKAYGENNRYYGITNITTGLMIYYTINPTGSNVESITVQ